MSESITLNKAIKTILTMHEVSQEPLCNITPNFDIMEVSRSLTFAKLIKDPRKLCSDAEGHMGTFLDNVGHIAYALGYENSVSLEAFILGVHMTKDSDFKDDLTKEASTLKKKNKEIWKNAEKKISDKDLKDIISTCTKLCESSKYNLSGFDYNEE